jgi:small subunit ribosomal protein S19e
MVAAKNTTKINVGRRKGATLRDVSANKWVRTMAAHLKQSGKLFVPNCTELTKNSHGNERAPQNPDWYYYRAAAVLRRIYLRPGTGYGGLGKAFAVLKNNGSRPEKTIKAARGMLHWVCRSLEGLKLVQKGKQSGRVLTRDGRRKCDAIAFNVKSGRKTVGAAAGAAGKKTAKK